jgi:putative nucleotidyltransferase-like protein
LETAGLGDFDPGHQLLLAFALTPAARDVSAIVSRAARRVQRWDQVLASVHANQLHPQAAAHLSGASAPDSVPDDVRSCLAAAAHAHAGRALFLSAELVGILRALRTANIDAVPWKGPAFAALSGDGLTSRELTDLDVLIRPADIERSVSALSALGYQCPLPPQAVASAWLPRATHELPLVARQGAVLLELHWRLAPSWFAAPVTAEDVLATAGEREFAGFRISWPPAEQLFLIHVADGMKSGGSGVRWLADLLAILRTGGIDWQQTRAIAERNDGLNNIRVALAVADALSSGLAASFERPDLALELASSARVLGGEARANKRLARAVHAIRDRLRLDARLGGAIAHFRWALQVADRPTRVAAAIARYASGPTIADLAAMPPEGLSGAPLRLRAFLRRLKANRLAA